MILFGLCNLKKGYSDYTSKCAINGAASFCKMSDNTYYSFLKLQCNIYKNRQTICNSILFSTDDSEGGGLRTLRGH